MTSKEDIDAQKAGAGPAAAEAIDVKPKTEAAPIRLVMTNGEVKEIEHAGHLIAHLNTGNIVIDPALAEKAAKHYAGPPLTIAEAFERGDFLAAARMIEAQIARALNGDISGGRYEDMARFSDKEKALKEREILLGQYLDASGGYRDSRGGYFNGDDSQYTDEKGGVLDNFGGYTYPDGSYRTRYGDYYDAKSHTVQYATGEVQHISKDISGQNVIKEMKDDVRERGGYDPDFIRKVKLGTVDAERTGTTTPMYSEEVGRARSQIESSQASQGPGKSMATSAPGASAQGSMTSSSLKDKLAKLHGGAPTNTASTNASLPKPDERAGSKFSKGPKTPAEIAAGGNNDMPNSSFIPVDSSISPSKFGTVPQDTADASDATGPSTKAPATRTSKPPAPQ